LHMAQLMPMPLTVSHFSKIQIGFTPLVPAYLGSPGQRAIKHVCVCLMVAKYWCFVNANCFMLKKNDSTLLGWRGSCCAVCMCVCLSVTMSGDGARLGLCAWLGCHGWYTARNHTVSSLFHRISLARWLGSRVVSVLDSGAVGPGFKLQP